MISMPFAGRFAVPSATSRSPAAALERSARTPTSGDAFAERKLAGRALVKGDPDLVQRQQEGNVVVASIGGFDLEYSGERFGKDGYRYATMLQRTGADYEIELPVTVTPVGAVSRLEHALSNFDCERDNYRHRLADAQRRLTSYHPRLG